MEIFTLSYSYIIPGRYIIHRTLHLLYTKHWTFPTDWKFSPSVYLFIHWHDTILFTILGLDIIMLISILSKTNFFTIQYFSMSFKHKLNSGLPIQPLIHTILSILHPTYKVFLIIPTPVPMYDDVICWSRPDTSPFYQTLMPLYCRLGTLNFPINPLPTHFFSV